MKPRTLVEVIALICSAASASAADQKNTTFNAQEFAKLHALIKPAPDEAQWAQVPWMPSTDIWAARQKAAAEGKPVFLWYMAGEPLGSC